MHDDCTCAGRDKLLCQESLRGGMDHLAMGAGSLLKVLVSRGLGSSEVSV